MRKIIILCMLPVFTLSLLSATLSCQSQTEPISTPTPTVTPTPPPSPSSTVDTAWMQHYDNGKALAKQGNYEEAVLEYTKAIELCDSSSGTSMIYQDRGDAYLSEGKYDQAIADYTTAIEDTTEGSSLWALAVSGSAYLGRAEAYNKKGDYEKAKLDASKAVEKQEAFEKLRDSLGTK